LMGFVSSFELKGGELRKKFFCPFFIFKKDREDL